MITYIETTQDVTVTVQPLFMEERSDVMKKEFVFAYFITIANHNSEPVQLLRRTWHISDSNGENHEVEGEGVVGQQPEIDGDASYSYNSFCVLKSFEGHMEGSYLMQREDGSQFEITIPRFFLKAYTN
jgi:ApaG protein